LIGDGAVVDERGLVGAASFDVPVERVEAGVELAAGEPAVEGGAGIVENLVPPLVPVDCVAGLAPERFGILNRTIECVLPGAACAGCGCHGCAPIILSFEEPAEFTVPEITWCCDGGHMRILRGISVNPETNYLNATHKASQVRFGKPSALLPTHLVEERI
jgi:hypothetical protein